MTYHLPTSEVFERHHASGLTRYTFEQANAALADLEASVTVFQSAYDAAYARIVAEVGERFVSMPVWYCCLPEHLQAMWDVVMPLVCEYPSKAGKGSELFPVGRWQGEAKRNRRNSDRIRKALAKVQEKTGL